MAESTDNPQDSAPPPNDQGHSNPDQPEKSAAPVAPSLDSAMWAQVLAAMKAAEDAVSQAVHGTSEKAT